MTKKKYIYCMTEVACKSTKDNTIFNNNTKKLSVFTYELTKDSVKFFLTSIVSVFHILGNFIELYIVS